MSTQTRQPAGAPVGGQFTTHPKAEAGLTLPAPDTRPGSEDNPAVATHPELTLEQIADVEGDEDPTFDPDDQYGADLNADEMAGR